jgi:hypothetical protein
VMSLIWAIPHPRLLKAAKVAGPKRLVQSGFRGSLLHRWPVFSG